LELLASLRIYLVVNVRRCYKLKTLELVKRMNLVLG